MTLPNPAQVGPLRIDYGDEGVQLQSFALRDIGIDALFDLPEPETIYRAKLGDMRFLVRKLPDGSTADVYFAPEYPNNDLGLKERITTYYAWPVTRANAEICELHACDPGLRIVDWDVGILLIAGLRGTADRDTKRTIERILEVDSLLKQFRSNLSDTEMRQTIGPASGARFTTSPFLVGDVA